MARVRPLAGVRPTAERAAEISAPPYDTLSADEGRALLRRFPRSFLRVSRPDILFPPGQPAPDQLVLFARAREELDRMLRDGELVQDPRPCFYLYEQTMGRHRQVGVVGAVSVEEYLAGAIKRHENTRSSKEAERTAHIVSTRANSGLVFLTYRKANALDLLVQQLTAEAPEFDFWAHDGVRHRLWVVGEKAQIATLQQLFAGVPTLYIADGHHRAAAAARVYEQQRALIGSAVAQSPHADFLAVLIPHDQLQIMSYHRYVNDVAGRGADELLRAVERRFSLEHARTAMPPGRGVFGMYLDGQWKWLRCRRAEGDGPLPARVCADQLDAAVLQRELLAPLLTIENPRDDPRLEFVGGIRGTGELQRLVSERGGVAFTLYPTAIEEVMAVADAGEVMPPKSTWFEPKLRSGLVVRLLS
jgi:uncharacterized protein (DUF1015 family)